MMCLRSSFAVKKQNKKNLEKKKNESKRKINLDITKNEFGKS